MSTAGTAYVVRSGRDLARQVLLAAGWAALVVVVVGFVAGRWWLAGAMGTLGAVACLAALPVAGRRLRVDERGITLGGPRRHRPTRRTPWPQVHTLVVEATVPRVTVLLRAGTPLPHGLSGRITDPGRPGTAGGDSEVVPGLDPAALERAVRALAPDVVVEHR